MRYIVLAAVTIINLIFTGAVFPNINIAGLAPDLLICAMTSIAVLERSMAGAGIGLISGIVLDLFFSGAIGFYAIPYLITGTALYVVSTRFRYIDSFIMPFFFAIGAYLIKELLSALLAYMLGTSFSFPHMLMRYILPEALLTGVFMLLVHLIMRKIYRSSSVKPGRSEDIKKLL